MSDTTKENPRAGDYVLATKYEDGDPCDYFFVGFVTDMTWQGRYLVADLDGRSQRHNGFRRAEVIASDEGRQLVEMVPTIGGKSGPSVWWHLRNIQGKGQDAFCEACKYEKNRHCRCGKE